MATKKSPSSTTAKKRADKAPPAEAESTSAATDKSAGAPKSRSKASPAAKAPGGEEKKATKPAKVAGITDKKFLHEQEELLFSERRAYEEQVAAFLAEAEQLAADAEPGDIQFDEESGEGDTMSIERERDLALSAQGRQHIEEIDRALAKIKAGSYGICERCNQPIPRARLKAVPHATQCVSCKSGGLFARR